MAVRRPTPPPPPPRRGRCVRCGSHRVVLPLLLLLLLLLVAPAAPSASHGGVMASRSATVPGLCCPVCLSVCGGGLCGGVCGGGGGGGGGGGRRRSRLRLVCAPSGGEAAPRNRSEPAEFLRSNATVEERRHGAAVPAAEEDDCWEIEKHGPVLVLLGVHFF
ncbi:unnamed protein product [Merluccius merluccius]